MANTPQLSTILANVQGQVQGLNLTYNDVAVPVVLKKIAEWLQQVSLPSLPIVLIAIPEQPEEVTPWSSEDEVLAKYAVPVLTIASGNRDNTANMTNMLSWREQERRLFQWGLQAKIQSCFFSEFVGQPPIIKELALKNYDVTGFAFRFWNVESRT